MGVKISDLPAAVAAESAMQFEVNNAGVSQRLTLVQMFALSTGAQFTDGAVATPAIAFASEPGLGFFRSAATTLGVAVNNAERFNFRAVAAGGMLAIQSSTAAFLGAGGSMAALDCFLARDAANTLALRNGTSAQDFRVYNTFTDTSNYERGYFRYASNTLRIGHEAGGTGSAHRNIQFDYGSLASVTFRSTAGVQVLVLSDSGGVSLGRGLLFGTDNTYDIGAAASGRPQFVYAASGLRTDGSVRCGPTSAVQFGTNRAVIASASDGVLSFYNAAQNDFARIQFGGTTNAFPALKRSGTTVQARLADDSGYGAFDAANYFANGTQVLTTRRPGWTAPTGTATRTGFATGSATLQNVAEALKALIDDLTTHGLIGA
jgi:hypothetical protein